MKDQLFKDGDVVYFPWLPGDHPFVLRPYSSDEPEVLVAKRVLPPYWEAMVEITDNGHVHGLRDTPHPVASHEPWPLGVLDKTKQGAATPTPPSPVSVSELESWAEELFLMRDDDADAYYAFLGRLREITTVITRTQRPADFMGVMK